MHKFTKMNKIIFPLIGIIVMLLFFAETYSSESSQDFLLGNSDVFMYYDNRYCSTPSLLQLEYGRSKNSEGNYFDNNLDTINGLKHKEYSAVWKNFQDFTCFNMCIGLYIDTIFPSMTVKRIMLEKVDSVLTEGILYDMSENELISLKSQRIHIPDSLQSFLTLWEWNFDRCTKVYNSKATSINYNQILDSRGCVVCHRIYEDPRWATYILECSVNSHGSCGCGSSADYITIDKNTGHILSKADILSDSNIGQILEILPIEYRKVATAKRATPCSWWDNNGEGLFNQSNGVALVNEGILIYFVPYNIGCGAEGQYNIIIPINR